MSKKFEASRKLTKADGTIAYIWEGKFHNWEGPALIPEGNNRKREYYINGIKMSENQWNEALKGREGLPFYKQSGGGNRF